MKTTAIIHESYGKKLFLDEIILPDPGADEVIVKMFASGICGSQLLNLRNSRLASPELLGHEGTGVVVKKGSDVKHVKEGDHVLISWMPYGADEKTEYLKWVNVQWNGQTIKTLIFTWAKDTIINSQFVSKIDKDFERYTTSIIGCAGIAGYGTVMNTVKINKGQSVVVFGVGGLGILSVNAAKVLGASPIIAVDIDDEKLEFSKKFGATHTINSTKMDVVKEVLGLTNGGADFVFDIVGIASIREQTILCSKMGVAGYCEGGTTVLVGFPEGVSEFNPRSLLMGQRTYKGSRGGACVPENDFPKFYDAYKNGELLLDQAVTRRYRLEDINEAVAELGSGKILGRAIIEIS